LPTSRGRASTPPAIWPAGCRTAASRSADAPTSR